LRLLAQALRRGRRLFHQRGVLLRAASALRCARLRTSPATTAKPRPCSPARAASFTASPLRCASSRTVRASPSGD